jgi:hypothetical protein
LLEATKPRSAAEGLQKSKKFVREFITEDLWQAAVVPSIRAIGLGKGFSLCSFTENPGANFAREQA